MTNEELPTPTRHRGTARAYVVAFAGCAAMIVGALVALVAGLVLPDGSAAQTVVAGGALWIVAGCVVVTAVATLYLFAQFIWTLAGAGKGTYLPAASNTRQRVQD